MRNLIGIGFLLILMVLVYILYDYFYNSDLKHLNTKIENVADDVIINSNKLDTLNDKADSIIERINKLEKQINRRLDTIRMVQDTIKNDVKIIRKYIENDNKGLIWKIP